MAKFRNRPTAASAAALTSVKPGDPNFYYPDQPFKGSLRDMFPFIVRHPLTMETALMRAVRLIKREGIDHVRTEIARRLYGDEKIICWNAFGDIHGIDPVLSRFVASLQAAALNQEQAYQVVVLQGGPSTAKSYLANRMKDLFIGSEPPLTFTDSKVQAHPLCAVAMIPVLAKLMATSGMAESAQAARTAFLVELGLDALLKYDGPDSSEIFKKRHLDPSFQSLCKLESHQEFISVIIEGLGQPRAVRAVVAFPDINVYEPLMRAARNPTAKLNPVKMLSELIITPFHFLSGDEGAVGISTVKEVEPFKFDFAAVYGEERLQRLMKDNALPEEMVDLIGSYPKANRGVMEWVEFAKNGLPALRSMLEASQDRRSRYPDPLGTRTFAGDWLMIAHTNTNEYIKLVTTPGNEPYEDRFTRLDVLQPIRADAIRQSLIKQWRRSDSSRTGASTFVNIDPLAFDLLSDLMAASRIKLPEGYGLKVMKVIDIISGAVYQPREAGTRTAPEEVLSDLGEMQGQSGLTLRWATKILGTVAGQAALNGQSFVLSRDVFNETERTLRVSRQLRGEKPENDIKTTPTSELGLLHTLLRNEVATRRAVKLARMVRVALKIYMETMGGTQTGSDLRNAYKSNYLRIIESLLSDPNSVTPDDEAFANSIEAELGVASSSRERFRETVAYFRNQVLNVREAHTRDARDRGELGLGEKADLPLEAFEPLRRAIDRKIAKEISPATATSILRATAGIEGKKREGALNVMSKTFGLTPEIAAAVAEEVEERNLLNELSSDDDF
jgi:predicted Ser/Thr protein kinase